MPMNPNASPTVFGRVKRNAAIPTVTHATVGQQAVMTVNASAQIATTVIAARTYQPRLAPTAIRPAISRSAVVASSAKTV